MSLFHKTENISQNSSNLPAHEDAHRSERRFLRWDADFDGMLGSEAEFVACTICDLSPGGARVKVADTPEVTVGVRVVLELPDYGLIDAEVRHVKDEMLGLSFRHAEANEFELARHLLMLKENDENFVSKEKPADAEVAETGWLMAARLSFGGLAHATSTVAGKSDKIKEAAHQIAAGTSMHNLDEIESRAQLAAQMLANRQERERELFSSLRKFESEVKELRQRCEQLEDEAVTLRADKKQLADENEQLLNEGKQFKADGKRVQEEFGILQDELDSISRERDGLRSTLDALVTQIELNVDAEADEVSNEQLAMAQGRDNEPVMAA